MTTSKHKTARLQEMQKLPLVIGVMLSLSKQGYEEYGNRQREYMYCNNKLVTYIELPVMKE